MMRYSTPNYRQPKDLLDKEIDWILNLGIEATTNIEPGENITFDMAQRIGPVRTVLHNSFKYLYNRTTCDRYVFTMSVTKRKIPINILYIVGKVFKTFLENNIKPGMENKEKMGMPLHETRASILVQLLSEDLSALHLEEKLGINESAIRRHLDILEGKKYVEHYFEKAPRGRPKKLYSITEKGRGVFPQKTHLLFSYLAKSIMVEYGEGSLRELLFSVADRFAARLTPELTAESKEERLKNFVEYLDKFGFYPKFAEKSGDYFVTYRNCVFGEITEEFRGQLCEMHREIVRRALPSCKIEQKKSRAQGDNVCIHRLCFEED